MGSVDHDVVIIGGGHNGLVAARYLAGEGLDVLLLERREILGGASIHPGHHPDSLPQVLDILRREGVEPNRVVMSHVTPRPRESIDLDRALADTGCHLSFDTFGRDIYYASLGRHHPSDDLRIRIITEVVNSGYSGSIMLAHDCCYRMDLTTYGGHGYGHVLAYIVPGLKDKGVSDAAIQQMLVENPAQFLTFR